MSRNVRAAACAAAAVLATAASAWAAKPLAGKVYTGDTAHQQLPVKLTVSRNGQTVKLTIPYAPLYCQGGGGPVKTVETPAAISRKGTFVGTIKYLYNGKVAYKVTFNGYFATRTVATGKVRSEYKSKECSGSTAFTAEVL
jgi:hypothetical protein